MTQEEKFKEAQRLYKTANTDQKYVLESLFPELKESDDEKIRKALKEYFINSFQNNGVAAICGVHIKDILAWLEKQEHKLADMVEPKFKIGDWLVENEPNNYARFVQILEVINVQGKDRYRISRDLHNDEDIVDYGFIEYNYHSFNIKDAEAGDVLETEGFVFIFKEIREDKGIGYFCANEKELHEGDDDTFHIANPNSLMGSINNGFTHYTPATKEQRDQLEKAMADAGYAFDFEKKELKKIEQKPVEWSEKNEAVLDALIRRLEGEDVYISPHLAVECLKSLKNRVGCEICFTTTKEWSEDDEIYISDVLWCVEQARKVAKDENDMGTTWCAERWLKSLKARYTWKPSGEIVGALNEAINNYANSPDLHENSYLYNLLYNLGMQLKKLREE